MKNISPLNEQKTAFESMNDFINRTIIPRFSMLKECINLKSENDEPYIY